MALLASAATLATAYFAEYVLNQAPCQMCWWQRYVYFAAGGLALVAIALKWRGAGPKLMTALSVLLGLTFLVGVFIAGWHSLFEWDLVPGPEGCAAIGMGQLPEGTPLSELLNRPQAIPSCKEALWRIPNAPWGLSMAGWNALVLMALTAASFYASTQPPMSTDTANEPVQP